jgi:hypothetical protein
MESIKSNGNMGSQRAMQNGESNEKVNLVATALQPILTQQKSLFYELERLVSTKVDRIEFSQIIQNKAN